MSKEIELVIKITAPPLSPEGEDLKVAEAFVKLAEVIAELQGAPKPKVRIERYEQSNQG